MAQRSEQAFQPDPCCGFAEVDLALENSGLDAHEIDYLLFGTMTPDRFIPGTGIRDRFASRNADSANGAPLRKFLTGVADLSKSNECFPAEVKFGGAE